MDGCQSSGAASCKTLGIFCSTRYDKVESHHLWLHSMFNYVLCLLETLGCSIDEKGFHQVELQIAAWDLEVEKIGFCVLYKHDIEDRNWGKMEYDDTFFCWWWNLVFEDPNQNKWIHDEDDGVEPRFKDSDDWIMANHMRNFFLLFFYLWVINFLPTLINHFSFLCAAYVMLCFFGQSYVVLC